MDNSVAFLLDDIHEEKANDSSEKDITSGNAITYIKSEIVPSRFVPYVSANR